MTRQAKTLTMYQHFSTILAERRPMTVRQVYYQMVVNGWVENNPQSYDRVQRNLDQARWDYFDGLTDGDGQPTGIPPEWIEDRIREYRGGRTGFLGLPDFWAASLRGNGVWNVWIEALARRRRPECNGRVALVEWVERYRELMAEAHLDVE